MSADPISTAKDAQPAGRAKSHQSGFSLLARGEPQIWFTGGMLVICLFMIVGLLTLIVSSGLPTFWPRRLEVIALNDGSIEIGQPQTTAVAPPASTQSDGTAVVDPSTLTADSQATDETESSETESPRIRHYYRTGNFDITGNHYRWLDPESMNATGIAAPAWATVVERLENGRLYGLPLQLSRPLSLPDSAVERLQSIEQLTDLLQSFPSGAVEPLASVLERVNQRRRTLVDSAFRELLANLPANASLQIQTDGDEAWRAPAQQPVDASFIAVRQLWSDTASLDEQLQQEIAASIRMRHATDELMLGISRLDAELSDLRAAMRRAELSTESLAPRRVEETHVWLDRLGELEAQRERLGELPKQLNEMLGDNAAAENPENATPEGVQAEELANGLMSVVDEEATAVQQQLDEWRMAFDSKPEPLRQAAGNYLQGYREVRERKQPLLDELEQLERGMRSSVTFAVPTQANRLEVSQEDVQQLAIGKLGESVREQLGLYGIELESADVELTPLNENLQFAMLGDNAGQRHLLALVAAGYVTSDREALRQVLLLPEKEVSVHEIVRAITPNQLTLAGKISVYVDRWREFLWENPREANTEGGIFPAIWGTVVMTLIMTIAVVPFGVMAALYLREYTHAGPLVSLIRISINNLAGVPSIVYGVFGFSFFCYTIGAYIDGGPKNADLVAIPSTPWLIAMGLTALTGTAAFFLSMFRGGPAHTQTPAKRWMSKLALILWLACITALAILILKSPFFDGFYREYLPNPTFGKGGLLWAALTLSLLTLPVVIVATEEALAAVPNSLREGSLACGASKWQTIRRIILPHARPGILTGAILAMARGAGEVAPLMLVGALPSAPDLPLDTEFPYFHASRSFMHLGYQIYVLGFQSQNSEATKPMVFTCALLLILIVAFLNLSAIFLRARLRRRFQGSQF